MGESTQHKLSRIRPPRVQITYDVELGGAIQKKEIPFVVGILSDLSGKNNNLLLPLKQRKFIEIDRDNFEDVMLAQQPALDLNVINWLTSGELRLHRTFEEIFEASSKMNDRNAESFVFNNADKILSKVAALLKDYTDDKLSQIDDLLNEIRTKADVSGELDEVGSNFLRKFNKMLRCFKFYIAQEKKPLRDKFKDVLAKLVAIPGLIYSGNYSAADIRAALEDLETSIKTDAGKISANFKFSTLDDFSPLRILHQVEDLDKYFVSKQYLSEFLNKLNGNENLLNVVTAQLNQLEASKANGQYPDDKIKEVISNILDSVSEKKVITPAAAGTGAADPAASAGATQPAADVKTAVVNPYMTNILNEMFENYKKYMVIAEFSKGKIEPNHIIRLLIEYIGEINELLNNQVNEFLHDQSMQKLEASWRALNYLIKGSETGERLKLRLLNISKEELQKDLEKAVEFDQSQLFKKVYEEEYGTFGGHPYGVLIGDYEFGKSSKEISLLTLIASVASAAHSPFIAAASPDLFDMKGFRDLPEHRDLSGIFESMEMIKWNSFRQSEDSRYIVLTLPRMLMRLPYGPETLPVEGFDFTEDVDGSDHNKYLWANSAFALGLRITDAFAKYSWCAAIRGVEGGGLVEDLPAHIFSTDSGDKALKCPTEIAITDRREKELSDLGFISLVHCKGKDYAAFFGGQTTQKPKKYDTSKANANARLSTVLPYILAASRFAHYLKVIVRDKVGSFMSADNVQVYLNRWIGDYVLGKDDAGQEIKAQYPLREARVDVKDTPGKPGCYTAVVFLRPHFQLEELTTSIRLVAELPPPAAA
jgi:type VI secretion system protein ImpC